MLSKDTIRLIEDNVKFLIEPLGFDLIELKSIGQANNIVFRFLVDRVEGGITLNECAEINHKIGQFLDEKDIISDRYMLEVSSPGLDRPLIDPKDFKRVLNKGVHIFLNEIQNGKLELEGELIRVDSEGVSIVDKEKREIVVTFSKIVKAKQAVNYGK